MEAKAKCPSLVELMMPEHENPSGNIFGGVLLSKIDIAGAIAARQVHPGRVVTVAMDSVIFKKPVLRGDLLICWADVVKVGNTSITTKIRVEVNRSGEIIQVTEAEATYVAVDATGTKVKVGTRDDGTVVTPTSGEYCVACSDGSHEHDKGAVKQAKDKSRSKKKKDKKKKKKKHGKCQCGQGKKSKQD